MKFKNVSKWYIRVLCIFIFFVFLSNSLNAQALPTGERLRVLGDKIGLLFGFALMENFLSVSDSSQYTTVAKREFNIITCENGMKWDTIHPSENSYNYTPGDRALQFANDNGMKMHGHTLVWHSQVPSWVNSYNGNASKLTSVLNTHIDNVVGHYKGKILVWDVANEIFNENGSYRTSIWYNTLGKSFVEIAFIRARQVDPNAKLIYNDYNIETVNSKSTAAYNMIKDFKQRGIPVDGIGLQTHLTGDGIDYNSFAQNMQRFADLGCEIYITEADVRIPSGGSAADLTKQTNVYKNLLQKCVAQKACKAFQVWGITDKHSWVPGTFPGQGKALLFDENYAPKQAYYAVQSVMASAAIPTTPPPTPTPVILLGDANNDNTVNIVDALIIAQYSVGLPVSIDLKAADYNQDGVVDILDALEIAQIIIL